MNTRIGILIVLVLISLSACKKSNDVILQPTVPTPVEAPLPEQPVTLVLKPVTKSISPEIGGYYQALPSDYDSTNESYPVIIFIHGAAQTGNGKAELSRLLYYGTMKSLQENKMPVSFNYQNSDYTYLYFAPQFKVNFSVSDLNTFIDYITAHYRINRSRIYLLGLSMGGRLALQYTSKYPDKIAAIVSMAGGLDNDATRPGIAANIASHNVAVWAIHNRKDQLIDPENSIALISLLQHDNPEMEARLTLLAPMGTQNHDAWTRACKLDFREDGKNLYEWFLEYNK